MSNEEAVSCMLAGHSMPSGHLMLPSGHPYIQTNELRKLIPDDVA